MRITTSSDHNSMTFSLSGRLDFNARHTLKPAIQESYDAQKRNIILDLTGVTFIDSAGIGLIHQCIMGAKTKKMDVSIINPQQQVEDILDLCNMTQYILESTSSDRPHTTTSRSNANLLTRDVLSIID